MPAPWVIEETKDVNLNDKRLNDRLTVILDRLGGHPTASIPAACGGSAEMAAALAERLPGLQKALEEAR